MSSLIKKTIFASLGVLSLSRKKAEGLAKELIKQGELAKSDEAKFIKDLMNRVEKNKAEMEKKTKETAIKTVKKLNVPTRKELNDLKASVDKLTKKLK